MKNELVAMPAVRRTVVNEPLQLIWCSLQSLIKDAVKNAKTCSEVQCGRGNEVGRSPKAPKDPKANEEP